MKILIYDGPVLPFNIGELIKQTYENNALLDHQKLAPVGLNGMYINGLAFSIEPYQELVKTDENLHGSYHPRERIYGFGDPTRLLFLKKDIKAKLDQSSNE